MNTTNTEVRPTPAVKLAYTKKELADLLGVAEITVWRLEKKGLITPIPGLRGRFTGASVARLCNGEARR